LGVGSDTPVTRPGSRPAVRAEMPVCDPASFL
jgi:hypothetical protein